MRICLYTETAFPKLGGQEVVVDALARQFLELGHEPTVVAPYPKRIAIDDGRLPYRVVRHLRFYSNRYFVHWYRRWLIRFQRHFQWDLWHCHSVYPCGYLAALARDQCHVPIVVTSHGGDIREGNVRLRKPGIESRCKKALVRADALVAISDFTDAAYRRLNPHTQRIIRIPNGVEFDFYTRAVDRPRALPDAISSGQFALFLGRLHERKGVDLLLGAFDRITASSNIDLVIAGDGPERVVLEQQARRSQRSRRIHFIGAVGGDTKIWLLQNARVVVIPSRTWESFGLVVLEAYAAGRPVIATQLPGLCDLVEPERTGLTVPAERVEPLAAALEKVLADRQLADRFGNNAREKARQYTWRAVAQSHIALYQDLVDGHRDRRVA